MNRPKDNQAPITASIAAPVTARGVILAAALALAMVLAAAGPARAGGGDRDGALPEGIDARTVFYETSDGRTLTVRRDSRAGDGMLSTVQPMLHLDSDVAVVAVGVTALTGPAPPPWLRVRLRLAAACQAVTLMAGEPAAMEHRLAVALPPERVSTITTRHPVPAACGRLWRGRLLDGMPRLSTGTTGP